MDEKSVPNWGLWVGARRLEGYCLGPISCGLPRGGGSLGDRLGARATPLSVRPHQMPSHHSLLTAHYLRTTQFEHVEVEFSHHGAARQPYISFAVFRANICVR